MSHNIQSPTDKKLADEQKLIVQAFVRKKNTDLLKRNHQKIVSGQFDTKYKIEADICLQDQI